MKKGFTLVELLAVLIILGVIAAFAVPKVVDVITESKKETTLVNAKSYIKAINKYLVENDNYMQNLCKNDINYVVGNNSCTINLAYEKNENSISGVLIAELYNEIKISGTKPEKLEKLKISSDYDVLEATLTYSGYIVKYDGLSYNIEVRK